MVDVGMHTHLDDAVSVNDPQILAFAEQIQFGAYEGTIYERLSAPEKAVTREKYNIGSRTRSALTGLIGNGASAGWNNSATTGLPVQAAYNTILTRGTVMQVGSEVVVVNDVNRSNNTISVFERGAGSTSAAAHDDGDAFEVIGHAINDTDAKDVEARAEETEEYQNYVQLMFEPIEQTFTDRTEARKYLDENPTLQREALERIFQYLARTTVKGVKVAGTNGKPGMTAGILDQLADATGRVPLRYNVNGTLNETKLKAALDMAFTYGRPTHIYCNPLNKRVFNGLNGSFLRISKQEANRAGEVNIEIYEYEGNELTFVVDRAYPNDRVNIVTESKIHKAWKTQDALKFVEEPPRSSRELRFSYQGKWTTIVRGVGRDHVDLYGITQ